jgi:hypothetical protein
MAISNDPQKHTGDQILEDLAMPGRLLAFVDDGGTPGKQIPCLAREFQVMCAVIMPSEAYRVLCAEMSSRDYLGRRGLDEFHATKIVNPGDSDWRKVEIAERIEVLQRLYVVLKRYATMIVYGYISGEQLDNELRDQLPPTLKKIKTKAALKHVFITGLVKSLKAQSADVGIVMDTDVAMEARMNIRSVSDPSGIYEKGVIETDSRLVLGVQLADLAAFTFNRFFHANHRETQGNPGPFDRPVVEGFRLLAPLFQDVLMLDD